MTFSQRSPHGQVGSVKRQRLVVGVEEDVEAVVDDRLAAVVGRGDRLAVQEDADGAGAAFLPVGVASSARRRA